MASIDLLGMRVAMEDDLESGGVRVAVIERGQLRMRHAISIYTYPSMEKGRIADMTGAVTALGSGLR